jgi:DNA end-binding protein Ku
MAVRASWTGTLGFGLVSIQVGTTPAVRENDVAYKQFREVTDEGTGEVSLNPVGRQNVDKVTEDVVQYGDIVRGYEASNGAIVKVNDAELDALAPESGKHIEIAKFVDLEDVFGDDLFFAKHEYVFPKKGGEKAYALMVKALATTGKGGLGQTVRRGKAQSILIRAYKGVMVLTFLHWDDEVRTPEYIDVLPVEVNEAESNMAVALIQAMAGDWKPAELIDTHREAAIKLLEAKAEGVEPAAAPAPKQQPVTDLMAALQASVEASKKNK